MKAKALSLYEIQTLLKPNCEHDIEMRWDGMEGISISGCYYGDEGVYFVAAFGGTVTKIPFKAIEDGKIEIITIGLVGVTQHSLELKEHLIGEGVI